ncbi:MAG TPA: MOSC domain-containing protein [Streptosporangiaceae bacterium]|jgi:MOSC domain-containing protein YiiM
MGKARIRSVSIGREVAVPWGVLRRSAIDKRPVASAVQVSALGLAGDDQADKVNHGGPDQALYAYAREDLDWWEDQLGRELRDGVFGENITTEGLDVNAAVIGEVWQLGGVTVQVTSPRVPCAVFRGWVDEQGWLKKFRAAGRPGPYLRVLRPGLLRAGQPAERLSSPSGSATVAQALEAFYQRDAALIRRLIDVPGSASRYELLLASWQQEAQLAASR